MEQKTVAVMGAGSWGTAIAIVLQTNGHRVRLWMRNKDQAITMHNNRVNKKYLPDIQLSEDITIESDPGLALQNADTVIIAVPTQQIRGLIRKVGSKIPPDALMINVAKGIEKETHLRISQVILDEMGERPYVVVSGPSHAEEVARYMPTTLVAASEKQIYAEQAQDLFMNQYVRVYTNPDVIGVELAGALKNVIAFGAGIADGIGYGDNARAALITRGITEIARLGQAMGASINTFAGLTGIGDLIVTCTSMHSRNRRAGILVGKGMSMEEALVEVGMVVEGVYTAAAAYELAKKYKVDMPITEAIYRVLYQNHNVEEAVQGLMTRHRKHEIEEVANTQDQGWTKKEEKQH